MVDAANGGAGAGHGGDAGGAVTGGDGAGGIGLPSYSESDLMTALLAEDRGRSESEPEIAASIVQQMLHMDLAPLPRSVRVRIRDVTARLQVKSVIEVGAGIGHLSAWLFDHWLTEAGSMPDGYTMVERGGRFSIVLQRLIERHDAAAWARVIAGDWQALAAASLSAVDGDESESPVDPIPPADLIIVHGESDGLVGDIEAALPMLRPGGLLLTPEPLVPTADVGMPEPDGELTTGQVQVREFNAWIALVRAAETSHSVGFVECTGGTLVAFRRPPSGRPTS